MRIGVFLSGNQPCTGHSRRCGNFSAPGTGFTTCGALHFGQVRSLSAICEGKLKWRREWDSNPRLSFPNTRFPSVLLKPLGHLSVPDCREVITLTMRTGGAFVT